MGELDGRIAIVTGGARGIGRGISTELARAGAEVVIGDLLARSEVAEAAEEVVTACRAHGKRAMAVACDVTDPEGPAALVAEAERAYGGVDVVVANAGVLGAVDVEEMSYDEWTRVLDVNATGTYLTNRAALPALKRRGGGAIVNIASLVGLRASPGRAHYSASKFAVIGFSQALAGEVAADRIRVNCIAPAGVRSEMTISELMAVTGIEDRAKADHVWSKVAAERLPFGRSVEPEDIGRAVVYLAAADVVSGTVLPVTGGEELRRSG